MPTEQSRNKNLVPILDKALDLMEYIGASPSPVTLPELQTTLGIAQASCYRIVSTLVQHGWLEKCSGNRYEIAAGVARVADKTRLRLSKYQRLQPAMNRIANTIGFSAKFSVRDGDEFVNVCSAQCRSGLLSFSAPGFRSPLKELASVSTIFLSESSLSEQHRLLDESRLAAFAKLQNFYREKGYCFIPGQNGRNAEYPFDTLSFPVRRESGALLGVISFLSLPGGLADELESIAQRIEKSVKTIANCL